MPKVDPLFADAATDDELLAKVVAYYHDTALKSDEVKTYLASRKLDHPELLKHFQIGYSDRTLGPLLPEKNRVAGREIRERLQRVGLYRVSGHEHFNGAITIPIFDATRKIIEVYGRKIGERLRAGTALHLCLHEQPTAIFNVTGIEAGKPLVVCGSILDALTCWCHGHRNVVAVIGADPSIHVTTLADLRVEQVFIAFGRDERGDALAEQVSLKLADRGIETFRVVLALGADLNDVARAADVPAEALGALVRQATWMRSGTRVVAPVTPAPTTVPVEVAVGATLPVVSAEGAGSADEHVAVVQVGLPCTVHGSSTPEPAAPETTAPVIDEHVFVHGDRRWRVRGLTKNLSFASMKLNVMVSRGDAYFIDTFEMYAAKARARFIELAADELLVDAKVIKSDLGKLLLALEALQEEQIRRALEPKVPAVTMTEGEREAALEVLRDPNLLDRVLADFERCGVVGERTNLAVGYLAATSRLLDDPLAVVIQSTSAAGKSSLMDAILDFIPPEERVHYSAMTGQSLYYLGAHDLSHRVLAIAEEEGASKITYALKLLHSEGVLTIASTAKEATTGRLVTQEYRVEGPVGIMLTTTSTDLDPELANRCMIVTVDESRAQTQAIHARQRALQTLEGTLARRTQASIPKLHRNAQRLLKGLVVVNPYAPELSFADHQTRTRRDHRKYLTLIRTVALLHQHQREIRTVVHEGQTVTFIEATRADVAVADRLMHESLARSLDELPPQTRRVLGLIEAFVGERAGKLGIRTKDVRFTRRELRDAIGLGHTQVKLHLARLLDMELIARHRVDVPEGGQSVEYELLRPLTRE